MDMTEYEILGISSNAKFHTIKNAYYDLIRIYHPDSLSNLNISKEERTKAFNILTDAYNKLKIRLNVNEVNLPEFNIKYEDANIKKNENITDLDSFNKEFDKIHSINNIDDPYSIYYNNDNNEINNINENKLILLPSEIKKDNNIYEFGINNVSDYSGTYYTDIRNIDNNLNGSEKDKEMDENEFNRRMKELEIDRNKKIELTDKELKKIEDNSKILNKIQSKKNKIQSKRDMLLIS